MDVGRALMAGESVSKRCLPSGPASTFREGEGEGATWGGKGNAELGRFTAGGVCRPSGASGKSSHGSTSWWGRWAVSGSGGAESLV